MKNKHFYQIFKLKIKPWIKYWLIKQTEFKGVLSDILEGISFYLTDSLNIKFKMFKIYGRTTQDGNPTPENPVFIKNTGDNGSVNEKIENFNIWDEEWEVGGISNSTGQNNSANTVIRSKNFISVQPNTQYYIKNGTDYAWFYAYDKNKNFLGYAFGSSSSVANEIKTTISNCYYLRFQCRSQYGATYKNDICINVSNPSINGKYVPHSEQNISFPLAEGQKLMQGDYLADDGIHSLWNEDTVNGTTSTFNDAKTNGAYYCNQKVSGNLTGQTITFDTSVTNAIVQYELAQEQVIPYTQEQKTAWEQIKNLKTYKPVTHISSEDETPAELKIQYWKEV